MNYKKFKVKYSQVKSTGGTKLSHSEHPGYKVSHFFEGVSSCSRERALTKQRARMPPRAQVRLGLGKELGEVVMLPSSR